MLVGPALPPGPVGAEPGLQLRGPERREVNLRPETGVRGHDGARPRLLAAPQPSGPSAGAGRERGVARGGAGSGRARVPELLEQRREVGALPDAGSPRVCVLWVGGAAGVRALGATGPSCVRSRLRGGPATRQRLRTWPSDRPRRRATWTCSALGSGAGLFFHRSRCSRLVYEILESRVVKTHGLLV